MVSVSTCVFLTTMTNTQEISGNLLICVRFRIALKSDAFLSEPFPRINVEKSFH